MLSSLLVLEKYEDEWGMDFAKQDYDALQAAFNNVASRTYSGAKTLLIRFRKYAKWRMTNGLPCTNAVFRLEADRTIAMRDSMVSSPAHLQSVLDAVFDSPYAGTADVIYRVLLWMGFAGLSDTEAVRVTGDELDFGSMRISHKGSEYPMYDGAHKGIRNGGTHEPRIHEIAVLSHLVPYLLFFDLGTGKVGESPSIEKGEVL